MENVRGLTLDLMQSVSQVIVGNEETLQNVTEVFITGGHLLDEDEPGRGKTLLMDAFAQASGLDYSWIQGTPDLRPADIVGGLVINPETSRLEFKEGPVFANIVVADEINRMPEKTQSSLLEAMQNRRVTINGVHYELPSPHMVLATQNTRNSKDVYELSEALLDRFPMRISMQELAVHQEATVYERTEVETPRAKMVPGFDAHLIRKEYEKIDVDTRFYRYVAELMAAARNPTKYNVDNVWHDQDYGLGKSTRPGEWLIRLAKAGALIEGKRYITADFIKQRLHLVINHRLKNRFRQGIDDATGLHWVRNTYVPSLLSAVGVPGVNEDELEEAADRARNK